MEVESSSYIDREREGGRLLAFANGLGILLSEISPCLAVTVGKGFDRSRRSKALPAEAGTTNLYCQRRRSKLDERL